MIACKRDENKPLLQVLRERDEWADRLDKVAYPNVTRSAYLDGYRKALAEIKTHTHRQLVRM